MLKYVVLLVLACTFCSADSSIFLNKLTERNVRQKRLLFYDEQGNLVKTYGNSLYNFGKSEQENIFYWSFLNTFLSPIFPTNLGRTAIAYMVPVSDAVVQQINRDPVYQNKLHILTYIDPIVEVNPLCAGRRAQIPSPKLCSNFLNCWDGWAFEQECPPGLLFSGEGYCDYPHNVDCNNRKLKELPKPLCKKDFEAFRSESDCNEFFVCVHSLPVRFKCPADLAYSENLGICDYPNRVECNGTMAAVPETINLPSQSSEASTVTQQPASTANSAPAQFSSAAPDLNMMINKTEFSTHTWTSTHVAISRQDAIRQLQLGRIANINTGN